jgi:two-component system, NarL family, sensor histidine kinase DesK
VIPRHSLFVRERGTIRAVANTIWLAFLVVPIATAIGNRESGAVPRVLAIAGAMLFVAAFVGVVMTWRRHGTSSEWLLPLCAVLLLVACLLTLLDRPGWGFLFTYCVAITSIAAPKRFPLLGLAVCTVLAGITVSLGGGDGGTTIGIVSTVLGIGVLMVLMRDLRVRNEELTEARAELARMAVAAERERFARDLHDLLGHSLSVIALKAELAGRLLPGRPGEAAREIGEVEGVARSALTEVREAVSGYRRPTLDDELEGARMALSAAGISADVTRDPVTLSPEVEAVLAWSVREGATNVIRHSGAKRCSVRVAADLANASVEVVDDGAGSHPAGGNGTAGHGLEGLAERAGVVRGRVDAGPRPDGGFGLLVTVPVAAS